MKSMLVVIDYVRKQMGGGGQFTDRGDIDDQLGDCEPTTLRIESTYGFFVGVREGPGEVSGVSFVG